MGYNINSTSFSSPTVLDELEFSSENVVFDKNGTGQFDSSVLPKNEDTTGDSLSYNQNSRRPHLKEAEYADLIGEELAALVTALNSSSEGQRDNITQLTNFLRQFSQGRAKTSEKQIEMQKRSLETTQKNMEMTKSQNDTMGKLNTAFTVLSIVSQVLPGVGGMLGEFFAAARTAMTAAVGVNRVLAFAGAVALSVPQIVQCIFGLQLSHALKEQARIEEETGVLGAEVKELAAFYDFFSKILSRDTNLTKESLENSFDVLATIANFYNAQKQMTNHMAQAV